MASTKRKREQAAKRLMGIAKDFTKMLYQDAVENQYEGTGYMHDTGQIEDVQLDAPGQIVVTIKSWGDPPRFIHLRLKLSLDPTTRTRK